jgi:hypothetical protein
VCYISRLPAIAYIFADTIEVFVMPDHMLIEIPLQTKISISLLMTNPCHCPFVGTNNRTKRLRYHMLESILSGLNILSPNEHVSQDYNPMNVIGQPAA